MELARFISRLLRKLVGSRDLTPSGPCSVCGSGETRFNYSPAAESDPKHFQPMCQGCLIRKLAQDYASYSGRAVVIEPAAGPPCYVFQPGSLWAGEFAISSDVENLLRTLASHCGSCSSPAKYLWVGSRGLSESTFGDVLEKGISQTLLAWGNPNPVSLCPKCCVRRIEKALQDAHVSYIEVSPPKSDDGFVIPMGY